MIMSKNVNELREEMRAEFERNMSSLMDYCIEQQQDEEVIGEQILEKEQEMNRMLDLYEFLQRAEKKLMNDIDEAIPAYDKLIKQANEIGIKKFLPNIDLKGLLNKAKGALKVKKDKIDEHQNELEMAELNVNKLMNITYDLSSQLNQIRYKVRKSPEDKVRMKEIINELEVIRKDIDSLMEMTSELEWKDINNN
jgi:hypothetical protein